MKYAKKVKNKLNQLIGEIARNPDPYVHNPGRDFSRKRKLGLKETMQLTISMEAGSIKKELLEFFHYDINTVSASAFIQQRRKLTNKAFYTVMHQLNEAFTGKNYRGYNLIACDGTILNLPLDAGDDTYYYHTRNGQDEYYQMSVSAMYDLCRRRYIDAEMQPRLKANERNALHIMLERQPFNPKTIIIADRGYEQYDLLAHIEQLKMFYVIRVKDNKSGGMVKENPDIYQRTRCINSKYFTNRERPYYKMTIRILRIKIAENNYECILTNLPEDEFPTEEIKKLYKMRWGIETSFRELKHTIGLTYLHSKKVEFIEQEILARLILYNFCEIITAHVLVTQKNTKHIYQLNYTMAIQICHRFLKNWIEKSPPDVESLIAKYLLPVRSDRSYPRKKVYRAPVKFTYRAI